MKRLFRSKRVKKTFAGAMSAVMAATIFMPMVKNIGSDDKLSDIVRADDTEPAMIQDSVSAVNYSTILGRGVDFGIVADYFQQRMHMQSTFAVGTYSRDCGDFTTIDLIPRGSVAQFLIGDVDYDNCNPASTSRDTAPVKIDGNVASTFNVEASNALVATMDTDTPFLFTQSGTAQLLLSGNDATQRNVSLITSNAYEASDVINSKVSNGYAIDYKDYYNAGTLDLTKGDFVNKVVYIDVDHDLLMDVGQAEKLQILKDESTVVVFNITDDAGTNRTWKTGKQDGDGPMVTGVCINKYWVSPDGGTTWAKSDEYSSNDTAPTNATRLNDKHICQKIIWNIRSTCNVGLDNSSGLFLVKNAPLTETLGTCAGWVVAPNFANSMGEWHYIYHGGSQDVLSDKVGQIHFAARKSFTHEYNGMNTVEDETVFSPAGKYNFKWYENDSNFSITDPGNDYVPVANTATNKLQFPTLTFYSSLADAEAAGDTDHYIASSETFYYSVREVGAGEKNDDGVTLSTGWMDIQLTVVNNNDKLEYYVKTWTYLPGGQLYKVNQDTNDARGLRMSGVEFSMGAFLNKTDASLMLRKTVKGGSEDAQEAIYCFYVQDEAGNYYDKNGNQLSTKAGIAIEGNTTLVINNLPDGKYYISEDIDAAVDNGEGLSLVMPKTVAATVDPTRVIEIEGEKWTYTPTANIVNEYVDASIKVTKSVKGDVPTNLNDQEYKFYIESLDNPNQYLDIDGKLTGTRILFSVKNGNSVELKPQFAGRYRVVEDTSGINLPPETTLTVSYTDQNINLTTDAPSSQTTITNTYKDTSYLSIIIEKEVEGADVTNVYAPCKFIVYYHDESLNADVFVGSDGNKLRDGWGNQAPLMTRDQAIQNAITVLPGQPLEIKRTAPEGQWGDSVNGIWGSKYNVNGTTYTIEEVSCPDTISGKAYVSTTGKVQEVTLFDQAGKKQQTATVINKYDSPKGSLQITKTVGGEVTQSEAEGALTFQVTTLKNGETYYLTNEGELTKTPTTLALKDKMADGTTPYWTYESVDANTKTWTRTWSDLPLGDYSVNEINTDIVNGSTGEKYTLIIDGPNKSVVTDNGEVVNGELKELELTDNYETPTAPDTPVYIDITKTFGGDVSEEDFTNLTFKIYEKGVTEAKAEYTFGEDFEDNDNDGTYNLKEKFKAEVDKEYYVVEENFDSTTGQSVKVEYSINGATKTTGATTSEFKVTDANTAENPAVAAFTNTYAPVYIDITKTFGGDVSEEDFTNLTFKIYESGVTEAKAEYTFGSNFEDTDNDGTYNLKEKFKAEVGKTYIVEESNYDSTTGQSVKVTYKINGGDSNEGDTTEGFTVTNANTAANPAVAAFTNTYTPAPVAPVYIDITKTFGGDISEEDFTNLTFKIYEKGVTEAKAEYLFGRDFNDADNDGTYHLNEMFQAEADKEYYVVESNYDSTTGQSVKVEYSINGAINKTTGDTTAEFTVTDANTATNPAVAAFTNTYAPVYIDITKTFGGDISEEDFTNLTFKIYESGVTEAKATYTFGENFEDTDNDGTYNLKEKFKAEVGKTYIVEESNYDSTTGQSVKVTYKINGGDSNEGDTTEGFTVTNANTAANPAVAAFTNTYTPAPVAPVYIDITKTFGGDVSEEDFTNLTFKIYEKGVTEAKAEYTFGENFEDTDGDGTYNLKEMFQAEVDKEYYVVESNYDSTTGQSVKVEYSVNGATKTTGATTSEFTVTDENTASNPAVAAFTNTYAPVYIDITKTFGGDVSEEDFTNLTFKIYEVGVDEAKAEYTFGSNFEDTDGDGTYNLKEKFKAEVDKEYYVVEENFDSTTGQSVKVEYSINGATNKTTGDTTAEFTVTDANTATNPAVVAFTNTYTPAPVYIDITKTFGGDISEEDFENLTFNIYEEGEEDAVATYQFGTHFNDEDGDGTYNLNELFEAELGKTYIVVETNYDSTTGQNVKVTYKLNGGTENDGNTTLGGFEVAKENIDTNPYVVAFTNTYSPKKVNLTITKTVGGDVTDEEAAGALKFVITKNDFDDSKCVNADGNLVNRETVLTLQSKRSDGSDLWSYDEESRTWTATFYDMAPGYYEVTETNTAIRIPGTDEIYTLVTDGTNASVTDKGGNLTATGTLTLDLKDYYELPKGTLEVTKAQKASSVDIPADKEFDITITFDDDADLTDAAATNGTLDKTAGTVTATLKVGEKVTVTGLPVGTTYTVSEARKANFAAVNDIDGTVMYADPEVTEVSVDNAYMVGKFELTKRLSTSAGLDGYDPNKVFTYHVTFTVPAGSSLDDIVLPTGATIDGNVVTGTIKKDQTLVFNNIPDGTICAVTEDDYTADHYKCTEITYGNAQHKISAGSTLGSTIYNEYYGVQPVYIDITKTFGGNVTGDDFSNLVFELYEDGNDTPVESFRFGDDFEDTDGDGTYSLKDKFEATVGTKYYVVEKNYDVNNDKEVSITYKLNGGDDTAYEEETDLFEVADSNTASTPYIVAFTNEYHLKTSSLKIMKMLVSSAGNVDPDKLFNVTVTLTVPDGEDLEDIVLPTGATIENNVVSLKVCARTPVTISGIPVGTTYTVVEADHSADKYVQQSITGDTGTIATGVVSECKITNKNLGYDGELKITKAITFANGDYGYDEDMEFTVNVTIMANDTYDVTTSDGTSKVTFASGTPQSFTIKAGETISIFGIDPDVEYVVTETAPDDDAYSQNGDIVNGTGTIPMNSSVTATVNNKYTAPTGSIKVLKALEGSYVTSGKPAQYEFYVKCGEKFVKTETTGYSLVDSEETATVFTVSEGDEGTTVSGLELGKTYSVVEKDVEGLNAGYSCEASYSADAIELKADNKDSASVTITNTFTYNEPSTGSIEITKAQSDGSDPIPDDQLFSFTVTFDGNIATSDATIDYPDATYAGGTISGDTWTFSLKKGQSAKLIKIPDGLSYTIHEDLTGLTGYADVEDIEGTIDVNDDAAKDLTFTVENTYVGDTGSLKIVKQVPPGSPDDAFVKTYSFRVTGPHGYDKTFDIDMNETTEVTIHDLRVGEYTVTELGTEEGGSATIDGYTLAVSGDNGVAVTLASDDLDIEATITNTYTSTEQTGEIEIRKTISGAAIGDLGVITFTIADSEGKVIDTVTLDKNLTGWTNEDGVYVYRKTVPFGTYVVTETANGTKNASKKYTCATTVNGAEGNKSGNLTIDDATDAVVGFANKYALITPTPGPKPTDKPTDKPTPTDKPSPKPTEEPTEAPTQAPTPTDKPTPEETATPNPTPTSTPVPTNAPDKRVVKVTVDGTEIGADKYTVDGTNAVSLTPSYTRTLSAGRHRIVVTYADGTSTEREVLISGEDATGNVIATGEAALSTTLLLAMIMIAASVFVFAIRKFYKKEDKG